jgi:hypothetical protein
LYPVQIYYVHIFPILLGCFLRRRHYDDGMQQTISVRPTILKSTAVAALLGVPYWLIHRLVSERRIVAPLKDSSGDYVWFPEDVENARRALAVRRRSARRREVGT